MTQQILNFDEIQTLEHRYSRQLPEGELMRRAGVAVADVVAEKTPEGGHVVIICGPGNNGGDGFACALSLKQRGFRVTCALIGCMKPKTEDALRFFNAWESAGGVTISDPYNADKAQTVVDALFGMGLNKPLSGDYQDAAMWFNERDCLHVSIDIASGLDPMTGNWVGGARGCMTDITVSIFSPKAGSYMNEGADASGEVIVKEIDVSVPLSTVGVIEQSDFRHVCERRAKNSHKGTYGHVLVIGGETGFVGAALLAARAALVMGAGRVTCELISDKAPVVDPLYPELMITTDAYDFSNVDTIVIGCGMGFSEKAKKRFKQALAHEVPLIIDADALRMLADDLTLQDMLLARKSHTVITPHPAEAAAILRCPLKKVIDDRIFAGRELSIQTGAISILKGIGSVVALRSSRTWINPTGNASLATAGSGDVLSGILGAMFAQHFDLVSATLSAVWLHGKSVDGCYAGVTAQEIAPRAASILNAMRSENR